MPCYDFRCTACNATFEAKLPFDSTELPPCPQCQKRAVEKLIAPPLGIHFRGSGFYKTDSRPAEKMKQPTAEDKNKTQVTKEKTAPVPHPATPPQGKETTKPPAPPSP